MSFQRLGRFEGVLYERLGSSVTEASWHYSLRTEEAYTVWIKRFILHHGKRHNHPLGRAKGAPRIFVAISCMRVTIQ